MYNGNATCSTAHNGGGIGEIWRSASMGLLQEKTPNHYREFMDNRRWHYELSRRFLLHPDYTVRTIYLSEIAEHDAALLDGLLAHDDARVRRVALEFLDSKNVPSDALTPARLEHLQSMIANSRPPL